MVVAAADPDLQAQESFTKRVGPEAFITGDYRKLLLRKDIDAVGVFSPDIFHEEHAIAVLKSGRHLFLEKPIAITTEGCDRILEAWRQSGKSFMVGFNMRYMPAFSRIKSLVDDGKIGDLKAIWIRHFVGAGGDFYFHDWHGERQCSNSLLRQKGSHDIDMILRGTDPVSHPVAGRMSVSTACEAVRSIREGGMRKNPPIDFLREPAPFSL